MNLTFTVAGCIAENHRQGDPPPPFMKRSEGTSWLKWITGGAHFFPWLFRLFTLSSLFFSILPWYVFTNMSVGFIRNESSLAPRLHWLTTDNASGVPGYLVLHLLFYRSNNGKASRCRWSCYPNRMMDFNVEQAGRVVLHSGERSAHERGAKDLSKDPGTRHKNGEEIF